MMTLDEAIEHCHKNAEELKETDCANEHLQLAIWLEELRFFREWLSLLKDFKGMTLKKKKYIREGGICQFFDQWSFGRGNIDYQKLGESIRNAGSEIKKNEER